jgi:hypothetical protein
LSAPQRTPDRIEEFVRAFFGPGNLVWPDRDPDSTAGSRLIPYLQVLRDQSEVPVVLPRRRPEDDYRLTAYVIALNAAHATGLAELLTAFVGPSFSAFEGLPARLDPDDPVDQAVLDFAGPGLVFTLSSPTPTSQARAWAALQRLQAVMKQRPMRSWHAPKPIGRLLAEFEVALAAGDNSASAALLEQLAASGGLSAVNLAHLRVKRLARLGRDGELLRMAGLADVVIANPPIPVKDAVLAALYSHTVAEPLSQGDLAAAREKLIDAGTLVPALISGHPSGLSAEALVVLALASWIRTDIPALRSLADSPDYYAQVRHLAPALADAMSAEVQDTDSQYLQDETPVEPADTAVASWLELTAAIAATPSEAEIALASQIWREWDPPAHDDQLIADLLAQFDDDAAERAWAIVGPFVDADGYRVPAARSARELIHNALTHDRFSPGDLAGLTALTEIVLRSGPEASQYAELLEDLRSESNRWAGPDRATVVLDLADLLARAACPDEEARLRLSMALLRPLRDHLVRLEPDQARFAGQLSRELGVGLEWPKAEQMGSDASPIGLPALKVLLYSLDEGVLMRTAGLLESLIPGVEVKVSHDHVGTPRLRQQSRGADLIVLATRCAKHAATGFIRSHARSSAHVIEANGSGSASMLRAAMTGFRASAVLVNVGSSA